MFSCERHSSVYLKDFFFVVGEKCCDVNVKNIFRCKVAAYLKDHRVDTTDCNVYEDLVKATCQLQSRHTLKNTLIHHLSGTGNMIYKMNIVLSGRRRRLVIETRNSTGNCLLK